MLLIPFCLLGLFLQHIVCWIKARVFWWSLTRCCCPRGGGGKVCDRFELYSLCLKITLWYIFSNLIPGDATYLSVFLLNDPNNSKLSFFLVLFVLALTNFPNRVVPTTSSRHSSLFNLCETWKTYITYIDPIIKNILNETELLEKY